MTTTHPTTQTGVNPRHVAIAGSILVNIVSVLGFLLPGSDEIPAGAVVAAFVFGALAALGAWGLAQRRRWGARLTIAVTALNVLSGVPGLLDPPSTSIAVLIIVLGVLGVATIAILTRPTLRSDLR
jgi:uncharacterized membrane protein (UPF0136 family)